MSAWVHGLCSSVDHILQASYLDTLMSPPQCHGSKCCLTVIESDGHHFIDFQLAVGMLAFKILV